MRKIYLTFAILAFTAAVFAQQPDSLLRRQLELERDFNPTLLDADKINSLPALREPTVQKANTNYSTWAGRTTPPLEIALPRPGSIMTEIPYHLKKGYLSFNAGNYANMDGAFGYRLVDNKKNNLSFNFLHNSSDGDIKYLQESEPASTNAYFMDNYGGLGYQHLADAHTIQLNLSYLHSLFNYYGNRFGNDPFFNDEKQRLGVLNARIGLESKESDLLNYRGFIDFKNFSTKYDHAYSSEPIKGNALNLMAGFDKPFRNPNTKAGIDGNLFTTIYNGDRDNYFLVNAAPYLRFGGLNSNARLGVDVLFQTGDKTRVRVVPNVALQLGLTEHSSLYANIHGGFDHNTLLDMMNESRYILPMADVRPSFTILDIDAGVKIGEVSGFRFDLFGGFKKTDDAHFLVHNGQDVIGGDVAGYFKEALKPVYGSLSHTHIGGMIQTTIWAPLDLSLRLKKNFYDVSEMTIHEVQVSDARAYNNPGLEVDMRGTFDVMSNLKFTLNYYFAGDRWTYFNGQNLEMESINDLNFGAAYQINDAFSLNLRANNLMMQKYDLWYGHPAQGFNASGGFTFQF